MKIAFQQPLVPVLPVARELITKTKWGAPKTHHQADTVKHKTGTKRLPFSTHHDRTVTPESNAHGRSDPPSFTPSSSSDVSAENLTGEPEGMHEDDRRKRPRTRVLSLFKRSRSKPRGSMDSDVSVAVSSGLNTCNVSERADSDFSARKSVKDLEVLSLRKGAGVRRLESMDLRGVGDTTSIEALLGLTRDVGYGVGDGGPRSWVSSESLESSFRVLRAGQTYSMIFFPTRVSIWRHIGWKLRSNAS